MGGENPGGSRKAFERGNVAENESPMTTNSPLANQTGDGVHRVKLWAQLNRHISSEKRLTKFFPKGTDVEQEGESDIEIHAIVSGWAIRHKTVRNKDRQIIDFLMRGDLIGLQSDILEAAPSSVSALTDLVLYTFDKADADNIYANGSRLSRTINMYIARDRQRMEDKIVDLAKRTAEERAASLIVDLYERAEALGSPRSGRMLFPITQHHIADAIGLSLIHTNRVLKKMQRDGLFVLEGRQLLLLDRERMTRLARG